MSVPLYQFSCHFSRWRFKITRCIRSPVVGFPKFVVLLSSKAHSSTFNSYSTSQEMSYCMEHESSHSR